jgi:hypothetical protein
MFGFGGLIGSPRVWGRSGLGNFFGESVVSFGRYVWGDARRDPVRWHNDCQVERDGLRRLSGLSISISKKKRNVYVQGSVELVVWTRSL